MMNKNKFTLLSGALCAALLFCACSNDERFNESVNNGNAATNHIAKTKQQHMQVFAQILSKASYDHVAVRSLLKEKALEQFDKNYDVLYQLVKNEPVEGKTLRDILLTYSSEEELEAIETSIPELNIYVSNLPFLDIKPEELDVNDQETPVGVVGETHNSLYVNGQEVEKLEKGEIPALHAFVVNENSRVIVAPISTRATTTPQVTFKSPNFDGKFAKEKVRVNFYRQSNTPLKQAYNYFNRDDNSRYQKAFQRDYLYYNMTPQDTVGYLNYSRREYISSIEINPAAYFKIADENLDGYNNNDPRLKTDEAYSYKKDLTREQVIDQLWTRGIYDIKFSIITSTSEQPQEIYLPFKPDDIWDFHWVRHHRKKRLFKSARYSYRVNPANFTAKTVFLDNELISFGKWDLSEESLYRYVLISEEDTDGTSISVSRTYEFTQMDEKVFKGGLKLSLGIPVLGDKFNASTSADSESKKSMTKKESKTISYTRKEASDNLGRVKIYYYDPIVTAKLPVFNQYYYKKHEYNTGYVKFTLDVR